MSSASACATRPSRTPSRALRRASTVRASTSSSSPSSRSWWSRCNSVRKSVGMCHGAAAWMPGRPAVATVTGSDLVQGRIQLSSIEHRVFGAAMARRRRAAVRRCRGPYRATTTSAEVRCGIHGGYARRAHEGGAPISGQSRRRRRCGAGGAAARVRRAAAPRSARARHRPRTVGDGRAAAAVGGLPARHRSPRPRRVGAGRRRRRHLARDRDAVDAARAAARSRGRADRRLCRRLGRQRAHATRRSGARVSVPVARDPARGAAARGRSRRGRARRSC